MTDHTEQELDAFAAWERDSWEQRAAAYAAEVGRLTCGAVGALLDAARVAADSRVLDVATGPGFVAKAAIARGARVVAVDQSAAMVRIARQRVPGLDVRTGTAERLGLPDGAYDAVVGGFVLNHLARPERALDELVRVLAPRGRLALTVWDLPAANRATGLIGEVVTALGIRGVVPAGRDATAYADDAHFAALLQGAGLADVTVTRVSWDLEVEPGAWFDTVARAMPRSGAVIAAAQDGQRAAAREDFASRALRQHGIGGGRVALPAVAVVGSGSRGPS